MAGGRIDEISQQLGRLDEGLKSLGKSLDRDREIMTELKDTFSQAVATFAQALRTHTAEINNIASELVGLKTDARGMRADILKLQDGHEDQRIAQAERKGMLKVGKWVLAVISTFSGAIGAICVELAKYWWFHPK